MGRIGTLEYSPGQSYGSTAPRTRRTVVSDIASQLNDETGHHGIHTFYETIAHESEHIVLWEGWWGVGGSPDPFLDTDADTYPDAFEAGSVGQSYYFNVGTSDHYSTGQPTTDPNARWPNDSAGYNYEETICRQVEHQIDEKSFDYQDWSHDETNNFQGKQHK